MLNFQFYQRGKVLCGNGAIIQLGKLADLIHARKALIICDAAMVATETLDKVIAALKAGGKEYVIFDKNEPNPLISTCEKGFDLCVKQKCAMVIGVGGGSNMECAKVINILRYNSVLSASTWMPPSHPISVMS